MFGVSGCASPILYSTVNSIVKDDSEERAIIMVRPSIVPSSQQARRALTDHTSGVYDDLGLFLPDLGTVTPLPDCRAVRGSKVAARLAGYFRVLLSAMGWLHYGSGASQACQKVSADDVDCYLERC